ncbi:MAG: GWxTD domain-containing protein [bacterium]
MKKIFIILFILLQYLIFPQELKKTTYIEANVIKNDLDYFCYLSFRVQYNALVFVKDDTKYKSGFSLNFEICDSNKTIKREIIKRQVEVNNYEITNSNDSGIVGLMVIDLPKGKYTIKPYLELNNTSITLPQEPILFDLEAKSDSICSRPIIVQEGLELMDLVNYGGYIPYSDNKYDLVIPIFDKSVKEINIDIIQNKESIYSKKIQNPSNNYYSFFENVNAISIKSDSSKKEVNLFKIENLSSIIDEGVIDISVKVDNKVFSYSYIVKWFNKPKCLEFPELAIKSLGLFMNKDIVSELLNNNSDNYYIELKKVWNKYFPSPNTKYNKKMLEFYNRVDYAWEKFPAIGKKGGDSDRGIIYIKYGSPDKIERTYTERDNTVEVWYYEKIDKQFVFEDKTGLGNFTLLK